MKVRSLAAETINEVRLYLAQVLVAGKYVVDVYPATSLPDFGGTGDLEFEAFYNPNEDVTVTNITGVSNNTAAQRYQNVDEGVDVYTSADYVRPTADNVNTQFEIRVASGGFTGRPLSVTVRAVLENTQPLSVFNLNLGVNVGGVAYTQANADANTMQSVVYGQGPITVTVRFDYNPNTSLPWTAADIVAFDTTNEIYMDWNNSLAWPLQEHRVLAVDMVVNYASETRVATGSASLTVTSTPAWKTFTIAAIAGGNWSKGTTTDYIYVLRRVGPVGSVQWQGVSLAEAPPQIVNFVGYSATIVNGVPGGFVDQLRWYGIIVRTSAPADSADSQVYPTLVEESVSNTSTVTTELSNAAAKTYGVVTFMVKPDSTVNQNLTVQLKRRSDNVNMGTALTITKAEVDALPDMGGGWKKYTEQLGTAATLAAATQYYWNFSSTATVGAWKIANLFTGAQGSALSFGGTTDRSTRSGVESNDYDVQIMVGTIPTTPGSWAVSLQTQTVSSDLSEGTVNSIQYANCTWAATSLAGLFSYYEIQRTEDVGATWNTIAKIALEATVAFKDFEGLRNVACGYRIRVVRLDGAFSAWSSTQSQTPAKLAADTWNFVTNQANTQNCTYKKEGGVDYEFPGSEEVEFHPVFERDFWVVLQPTEDRGVRFEIRVAMSSLSSYSQGANSLGWALYNRLRTLTENKDLTYVCVHDPYGNRLLAKLQVPAGPYPTPNVFWYAVIRVTQLTNTFSTPAS